MAGIKASKIQGLVLKAITKQLGDLATACSFVSVTSVYDRTDSTTDEARTTTPIHAVFTNRQDLLSLMSRLAARGSVDPIESNNPTLRAIVAAKQLSDAGVTPKVNDVIARSGTEYTIESIKQDPALASYIFGLRLP